MTYPKKAYHAMRTPANAWVRLVMAWNVGGYHHASRTPSPCQCPKCFSVTFSRLTRKQSSSYEASFIHVCPFACSSTGNTSLAYSSMPLHPPHNARASSTTVPSPAVPPLPSPFQPLPLLTSLFTPLISEPKYGALNFPNITSIARSCSVYPCGTGVSTSMTGLKT